MFNFLKIMTGGANAPAVPETIAREQAAAMLGADPELLERFERSYRLHEANAGVSDNFFEINAKQAAARSAERFQ